MDFGLLLILSELFLLKFLGLFSGIKGDIIIEVLFNVGVFLIYPLLLELFFCKLRHGFTFALTFQVLLISVYLRVDGNIMVGVTHAFHYIDIAVTPVLFDFDHLVIRCESVLVRNMHRARCLRCR